MNTMDFCAEIAQIHNRLADISVRGDDAIRMAEVLTRCRNLVTVLSSEDENTENAEDVSADT